MSTDKLSSNLTPTPTIKLWTPRTIGFMTFFLSFLFGITLASINWMRMGMKRKALVQIAGSIIVILAIMLLPDNFGRLFSLLINLGYMVYLHQQMKNDIESLTGLGVF